LFAKIAMAIWFQVSGVRCQETCSVVMGLPRLPSETSIFFCFTGVASENGTGARPDETIHHLRHTLPFPRLIFSSVIALGLSAPMFSTNHSTFEFL
jgi:hypothetical protein